MSAIGRIAKAPAESIVVNKWHADGPCRWPFRLQLVALANNRPRDHQQCREKLFSHWSCVAIWQTAWPCSRSAIVGSPWKDSPLAAHNRSGKGSSKRKTPPRDCGHSTNTRKAQVGSWRQRRFMTMPIDRFDEVPRIGDHRCY